VSEHKESENDMSEAPSAPRKFVVLLVEDDDALRDEVAELLARDGYHVVAARDGRQALGWLDQLRPDLILLDLMLPLVSGWEVLANVRADPTLASVPVVVMTAYADQTPLEVTEVLRKPMGIDQVRQAVRRFCA
jgi:CheY-like chemotaxis protein